MNLSLCLVLVSILLHQTTGKRPPKQGAKVNKVKGHPTETDFADDASLTLEIQHSVGRGNEFYTRGTVHLKTLKSTSTALSFQQLSLPSRNITGLRMSAKYGGYYFIRSRSKFTDLLSEKGEVSDGEYVTTFISACAIVSAGMSDLITINGDGQGNVIGLTLSTPIVTGMDCENADEVALPTMFNTLISVDNGILGPMPNSQGFFQKAEKEEREKKEGKDNRSFLQKYWLYIVIGFIVFSLVNSAAGSAAGGGGGGQ